MSGVVASDRSEDRVPYRTRFAVRAGAAVGAVSRTFGRGSGTVIGGRATLALDPGALVRLAAGHRVVLVSGTNGKTTTTRLLTAALGSAGPVVTNSAGSNMASGLVATLSGRDVTPGSVAALEVDEGYLPQVVEAVDPEVVVLLNLTRDQLDRVSEVRMIAARWRETLSKSASARVVANADDPLVAWAAGAAVGGVTWVAAGQPWRADSVGCPECDGGIAVEGDEWSCRSCGMARPAPDVLLEGDEMVRRLEGRADRERVAFSLALPGRFNQANAVMAATAAGLMGVAPETALRAMAVTTDIAGRYEVVMVAGVHVRLLLAKNPAGWVEIFDLLGPPDSAVVLGINARVADGRDPSWLWDVPFERLAGRRAVATGERAADLAVRLRYAGVEHLTVRDPLEALAAAGGQRADFVGNYTAFQDLRAALRRRGAGR